MASAVIPFERSEQGEAGARSVDASQGDGAVQGDDRRRGDAFEHVVQGEDLPPVGLVVARGFVVQGGDRGLQLVRVRRGRAPERW